MSGALGHLVAGPGEHGVVRHAQAIADAMARTGHDPVVVRDRADGLTDDDLVRLTSCSAVHIAFTDRLFGATCEAAAVAFASVAERLTARGTAVVVGLHDLPDPAFGALQRRRADAYRAVVEASDAVIIGSHHEAGLARGLGAAARPLAVIPLPVAPSRPLTPLRPVGASASPIAQAVVGQPTVLGFIYPGKGHDDVLAAIDELPAQVGVVALGRPSDGHEVLAAELAATAAVRGRSFRVTGFVPDDELPAALAAAGVPIAPHARVSASASIAAWLGAGRRPLVPDVPYVRELERRAPGSMQIYRGVLDLRAQIRLALDDPSHTWLGRQTGLGPTLPEVARRHRDVLRLVGQHGRRVPLALLALATGETEPVAGAGQAEQLLRPTG